MRGNPNIVDDVIVNVMTMSDTRKRRPRDGNAVVQHERRNHLTGRNLWTRLSRIFSRRRPGGKGE